MTEEKIFLVKATKKGDKIFNYYPSVFKSRVELTKEELKPFSKKVLSKIEEALTDYYGEQCKDFDDECICCWIWEQWNDMKTLLKKLEGLK